MTKNPFTEDSFFVSPNGRNTWSGRLPSPDSGGKDGPFATLDRARRAVAQVRRTKPNQAVTVVVRGGTHFLAAPLMFTPADSGTDRQPVVYTAFPGEMPVISGGTRITGWKTGSVNGRECWVAELPDVAAGKWNFAQLFVAGQRRFRPRLPKAGFFHFADRRPTDFPGGLVRYGNGPTHAYYRPGDLQLFHNVTDVKLLTYNAWYETHHRLKAVDEQERRVDFQSRGFSEGYTGASSRYVVDNVFEALTEPGEWYLDRPAGRLYYLPRPGEDPAVTEVIAPRLATLVKFAGTSKRSVVNIRLEHLTFAHAEWDYAPDFAGSLQAADLVPGAIVLDRVEHCVLFDCRVAHVAQYAVDIQRGSHANAVIGCVLDDLGAGGVRVGNEGLPGVKGVYEAESATDKPQSATIADCVIRDGGKLFPSAVGIWIGNAGRNRVVHNHIFNLSYSGISCGWIWGYAPSRTIDNRIEGNHVHHIATDDLLHDLGGIYTLGVQPGSTIRNNYIHHIGGNGVYLDEGSSEFLVEGNLVHHVENLGITLHYGRDNLVRYNVCGLSRVAHFGPAAPERHRSLVHTHNVIYWAEGDFVKNPWGGSDNWQTAHGLFENNILWDARGCRDLDFGRGTRLADWQRLGQHLGTVIADPLFADPAAGDYSVRPGSPLIKLGIRPLDPARTGPRLKGFRPSYADWVRTFGEKPVAGVRTGWEQSARQMARLTVENYGTQPASGRLRLRCSDPGVKPARSAISFKSLRPGARQTFDVPLAVAPDAPRRVLLETLPVGADILPAAIQLFVQSEDWRIARLPAANPFESEKWNGRPARLVGNARGTNGRDARSTILETNSGLPAQLGDLKPRVIETIRGDQVATVRLALAGESLALDLCVTDHAIRAGELAWQGSCVEVFTSPTTSGQWHPSLTNAGIRQVFLVPAVGNAPALARKQCGQEMPAPEIQVTGTTHRTGYALQALVPLSLLELPSTGEFLFQIVVTTTPQRGGVATRAALFYGGLSASGSNLLYGLVRIS